MRLWYCMAEVEFVVAAEEEPDSYSAGRLAEREVRDNGIHDAFVVREIKSRADLPPDYEDGICPQSDETDESIGEILRPIEAAERERLERAPLAGQMELPLPAPAKE